MSIVTHPSLHSTHSNKDTKSIKVYITYSWWYISEKTPALYIWNLWTLMWSITLAQLLRSSQTAHRCPTINPEQLLAAATPPAPAPAPAHNSDLIANHSNLYVRPGPAVARLLSHAFNPNTFLGDPPESSAPAFIGANTTGCKKASILRMTLGKGQSPVCHILIYLFISPVHHPEAEKKDNPHIQRGYTLPESDVYNLEETDITQFRTHMTKLDLCIMYRMTTDDTYKDIHVQLLAHNTDLMKPKIPGLKSDNLNSLTFKNMGWCFLQLATRKPYHALLTYNKKHTEDQSNLSYMIQYASLESKFNGCQKKKPSSMPRQFTIVIAPTTAPICHNLHNRNLYIGDYSPKGIPDASQDGIHACFAEWAMHNLGFIM
ncbi:hypothetical protein F5146DRAFT_1007190 [Armillaria mellea]|nr:hypothetical protein F5146DRAFT_1007190 [Armillaria mellea]